MLKLPEQFKNHIGGFGRMVHRSTPYALAQLAKIENHFTFAASHGIHLRRSPNSVHLIDGMNLKWLHLTRANAIISCQFKIVNHVEISLKTNGQ